ncbi:MAG: hypothetical protein ACK5IB_10870 [Qingshengfaniella sp.]
MATAIYQVTDGRTNLTRTPSDNLRIAVVLVVFGAFLLPITAGLIGTILPAMGHFPVIDARGIGLTAWTRLFQVPGIGRAVWLSLFTGIAATAVSVLLAMGVVAGLYGRASPRMIARLALPILATPHAALAIGLAFVMAPSGWIARALALAFDWSFPPDLATVGDPWGLALIVGLVVKEVPFLALMIMAALTQLPVRQQMAHARALGYGPAESWTKVIFPQLWPLIRLPVMVVLAYGLSVVDMAMILGPSNPPVLSVLVIRMMNDPDLAMLLPASAGGVLQFGLVGLSFAALALVARATRAVGLVWLRRARREAVADIAARMLAVMAGLGWLPPEHRRIGIHHRVPIAGARANEPRRHSFSRRMNARSIRSFHRHSHLPCRVSP